MRVFFDGSYCYTFGKTYSTNSYHISGLTTSAQLKAYKPPRVCIHLQLRQPMSNGITLPELNSLPVAPSSAN